MLDALEEVVWKKDLLKKVQCKKGKISYFAEQS
jgi:hypothetical protein